MTDPQRRTLIWCATIGAALLIFGNKGFRDLCVNWREKRRLDASLVELRAENIHLSRELKRIQDDKAYTEFVIRKNLHYVRKEEVEYRILPSNGKSKS